MMLKLLKFLAPVLMWPAAALAAIDVMVVAPQEGEYRRFGHELAQGVKIAAQDINNHGGLLGQQINVVVADDRCEDVFALSLAQMLSVRDDKPNVIIGPYCSNAFSEAAGVFAKAEILQIVPVPLAGEKAFAPGAPLKIAGLRSEQAAVFLKYYQHNFAGQNVAVVYDALDRTMVGVAEALQQEFLSAGQGARISSFDFAKYADDYEAMAKEILQNNQIVYILGTGEKTAELTLELRDMDENVAVFTDRYLADENYREIMGFNTDGLYYLGLKNFKDSTYFTETLVNLRLQGMEPIGLGVYGFAALKLWAEVAQKAGGFAYDDMKKAAAQGEFMMPWGNMSFANGNFSGNAIYGVFRRQGEEYTQVD